MTFPKAERGIKIVFLAQISFMLASVFSTASAIGNMINYYIYINFPKEELLLAPFLIIAILAVIFLLAGFALTIIGVLKASGENENFKVALYSILFGVALSIIGMIWSGDNAVGIRAHHLHIAEAGEENTIPCTVERIIEDVFSTVVMLRTLGGGTLRMEVETGDFTVGEALTVAVKPEHVLSLRKEEA